MKSVEIISMKETHCINMSGVSQNVLYLKSSEMSRISIKSLEYIKVSKILGLRIMVEI